MKPAFCLAFPDLFPAPWPRLAAASAGKAGRRGLRYVDAHFGTNLWRRGKRLRAASRTGGLLPAGP
jgi:hypothetical protein